MVSEHTLTVGRDLRKWFRNRKTLIGTTIIFGITKTAILVPFVSLLSLSYFKHVDGTLWFEPGIPLWKSFIWNPSFKVGLDTKTANPQECSMAPFGGEKLLECQHYHLWTFRDGEHDLVQNASNSWGSYEWCRTWHNSTSMRTLSPGARWHLLSWFGVAGDH